MKYLSNEMFENNSYFNNNCEPKIMIMPIKKKIGDAGLPS